MKRAAEAFYINVRIYIYIIVFLKSREFQGQLQPCGISIRHDSISSDCHITLPYISLLSPNKLSPAGPSPISLSFQVEAIISINQLSSATLTPPFSSSRSPFHSLSRHSSKPICLFKHSINTHGVHMRLAPGLSHGLPKTRSTQRPQQRPTPCPPPNSQQHLCTIPLLASAFEIIWYIPPFFATCGAYCRGRSRG
jgi:hypothetical protein